MSGCRNPDLGNLRDFFRELDGSIITTAGENQRFPPGYFNLIFLDTFLNAFTQELPAERAPVPSIRTIKHHPFPGKMAWGPRPEVPALLGIPLKPQNLESEFPVPGPENPDF